MENLLKDQLGIIQNYVMREKAIFYLNSPTNSVKREMGNQKSSTKKIVFRKTVVSRKFSRFLQNAETKI